ncbi:MAG: HNH endonuclease [Deltaproteobacteria bacterium]|nr:HNH endonuclease [Deltaproteobacteria bacterium]
MNSEKVRRYREKRKHPCLDCGIPCGYRGLRCKPCSLIYRWANNRSRGKQAPINYCIDCEIKITRQAKRCKICAAKHNGIIQSTKIGDKHPSWKGGRHKRAGYVFLYRPDHPRANGSYVREHILVWEETQGRSLPKGWVVHHLNGMRSDNRPKNLLGMPYKKHHAALLQQAMQKRIQELEALLNNQHQLL